MSTKKAEVPLGLAHIPLRDQVRDAIRDRIIAGRYSPGERIVERELAAELGVSRIPIREAFRMLESEGFVEVLPRRGVMVRQLSREDIEELFDVREALEVLACRLAAQRAGKAATRSLERLLARAQRAMDKGDTAAVGVANAAFHDEIITLAGNRLLAGMLEPLHGRLHWLFQQNNDPERLITEHHELAAAIGTGDPDRAALSALRHVQVNREIALRLLFGTDDRPATG